MRPACDLLVWTAQLQLVLLGITLQWPGWLEDDLSGHYWLEKKH